MKRCSIFETLVRPMIFVVWLTPLTTGVWAEVPFAHVVAEQNLSATGISMEEYGVSGESVNRFNAALCWNVPIGINYTVGGKISYQLGLKYSSLIWGFDRNSSTIAANPKSQFNAGVGWSLNFGELFAPNSIGNDIDKWVFMSPDGYDAHSAPIKSSFGPFN